MGSEYFVMSRNREKWMPKYTHVAD